MTTLTNITDGPKVLNANPVIIVQPGETVEVEISEAELTSAVLSEWFEESSPAKSGKSKNSQAGSASEAD